MIFVDEFTDDLMRYLDSKQPTVIFFWAAWSAPCRQIKPVVDALADRFQDRARFIRVNIDRSFAGVGALKILSVPTLVLWREGKEMGRISGMLPEDELAREISRFVEQDLAPSRQNIYGE